jgi:hypothetical protein
MCSVEAYLHTRAGIYSIEEKRRAIRAIPKRKAVIKKNGIRKLVAKRERGGELLTIDDRTKAELPKEKEVAIAELEEKKEHA